MSRSMVAASSMSLTNAAAVLSGPPFTFACWVKLTTNNAQQALVSLSTAGTNTFDLETDSSGNLLMREFDGTISTSGSAGVVPTGAWHHCAGTQSSHSNRTSYLDGVAGTTDATTRAATVSNTGVGVSLGGNFLNGLIADAAMWNVVLSTQDIANLAAGLSPLEVRPDALVAYWPLWGDDSPEPDWNPTSTHKSLTLTNAPTKGATNPPVIPYLANWWAAAPTTGNIIIPILKSLSGTLTLSGVPSFQRTRVKALAGTLTLVGAAVPAFLFRIFTRNRVTVGLDPERITIRL